LEKFSFVIDITLTMKGTVTTINFFLKKYVATIVMAVSFACNKQKPLDIIQPPEVQSPAVLKPRGVELSAHSKAFYEYLPEGYLSSSVNTKYPLLIFFHGGLEIGNDSTELYKILKHGPLKHVNDGTFPASFSLNNKTYKFIIIAPQFNTSENSYPNEIDNIIEYAKQNFKVDASRIYLTGLSIGAGQIWNYVGKSSNYAKKIAAIVPIGSYLNEEKDEFRINYGKANIIGSSGLPIWSTHNDRDDICPLSWEVNAINMVKTSNPLLRPQPKLTVFNSWGHEGWTQTYDPNFKEENMNIYEWMLQYHR
jgi:predicted peptidase